MTMLTITISLDGDTANILAQNKFTLYAFQAVKTNITGWPTVWFSSDAIAPNMVLNFDLTFEVYTSLQTNVAPPQVVMPGASYAIDIGGTLIVEQPTGTGTVSTTGTTGRIAIDNHTTTQFTCGLSQAGSSLQQQLVATPICALPLFGQTITLIEPQNQVLLVFESGPRKIGQTVSQLSASSLLVSMDDSTTRTIKYSINTNWSKNTENWATIYSACQDLQGVLTKNSINTKIYV
jgi:hypothetical protein